MRTKHRKTVFAFFPFAFAFQANTRRAKTRQNMTHTHTPHTHTHTHTHTRRQLAVYLTSQLPPRSAAKPSISKYRSCRWTYFLATAALQFLPSFPSLCNFGARLGAPIGTDVVGLALKFSVINRTPNPGHFSLICVHRFWHGLRFRPLGRGNGHSHQLLPDDRDRITPYRVLLVRVASKLRRGISHSR